MSSKVSTVSSNLTVGIPKKIARELGIVPGSKMLWTVNEKGQLVLTSVKFVPDSVNEVLGKAG